MSDSASRPKRIIIPPVWFALGLVAVFLLDCGFPQAGFSGTMTVGLGMALVLLGTALITGAAAGLLVAPAFMLIIQRRFILGEEQMMSEIFGEEYEDYRRRVRRWL